MIEIKSNEDNFYHQMYKTFEKNIKLNDINKFRNEYFAVEKLIERYSSFEFQI